MQDLASTSTNQFMVRSDGMFFAHMGDVILKSEKRNETNVFPFTAQASTPDKDREGETLLQKGLNFEPFKSAGHYNWNHIPFAIVGVPTGKKAWLEETGWHCEGEIISGLEVFRDPVTKSVYTTDQIVCQHNQMKKAGYNHGLHVSVEGKVTKRSKCGKYVEKADIYHIACTFTPVNPNCSLKMLAKSMAGKMEIQESDSYFDTLKSLSTSNVEPMVKEDLEGSKSIENSLVSFLMKKGYSGLEAKKYVYKYLAEKFSKPSK